MTNHVDNRALLVARLREELFGPSPQGQAIDTNREVTFPDLPSSYGPWRQRGSGEEILQRDRPLRRYGIGVLYPLGILSEPDEEAAADEVPVDEATKDSELEVLTETAAKELHQLHERVGQGQPGWEPDPDDFDLSTANDYRPSTMAVSFLGSFPAGSVLHVRVEGGRYTPKQIHISKASMKGGKHGPQTRTWWLRQPVSVEADFEGALLVSGSDRTERPKSVRPVGTDGLSLELLAYTRPRADQSLVTLSLINRTDPSGSSVDETALFQCGFDAWIETPDGRGEILPYPADQSTSIQSSPDPEEDSFDLIYREAQTFAVGHGCSADWKLSDLNTAASVSASCLPVHETPSITPTILRDDQSEVSVPMGPLAGLDDSDDGLSSVREVFDLYASWIAKQELTAAQLEGVRKVTAERHLADCRTALVRMRDGLDYLEHDSHARDAFRLANRAVLLQQLRTRRTPRAVRFEPAQGRLTFADKVSVPDWRTVRGRGAWRPFQIAFLLMSLRSATQGKDVNRETVELIWFPTGGGKTEAYLGLAAFSLFYRRLVAPSDVGVGVLMRYTLRLLTAQQFQRAASLICAMESLRREREHQVTSEADSSLGDAPFSIGMWLGQATTPNNRAEGRRILKRLNKGDRYAENKFGLLRCPWCAAQMGPFSSSGKGTKHAPRVAGYSLTANTVALECPDIDCEFSSGLPVYVIDEDIYEVRPSLVIGTVDKFAALAWNTSARALFGLGTDGESVASPPNLIIQDELHLISGPLGSMVGLYESAIEELCTSRDGNVRIRPKIVGSTATIRRYDEQISALYARTRTDLFPPRGLDADDSFFARYARDSEGNLRPGRIYVGVHGGGLGSVQTAQVRTFAALLQAPVSLQPEDRDPWWTLMAFFNSLRELGTSLSLMQSDIPDYLKVIRNRLGIEPREVRRLRHILELTGRMRSDEVPKAIDQLSSEAASSSVVDVCLASNIIEVGIDIDRLSLMVVVGQPKTTAQYIQVTGRVGRLWEERPGVIVTIYSPSKPRDRSHFEKFRSYHERLYAQVEPTSVTPFSPPVLSRALHAVMVSYVRQKGSASLPPYPVPHELVEEIHNVLSSRVDAVDSEESETLERIFEDRLREWEQRKRSIWSGGGAEDIPLLRRAGEYASRRTAQLSWATPNSMRNVDAECQAEISRLYVLEAEETPNA